MVESNTGVSAYSIHRVDTYNTIALTHQYVKFVFVNVRLKEFNKIRC